MKTPKQLIVGWTLFSLSALLLLGFIGGAWWWYRPSPNSDQTIVLPPTSQEKDRSNRTRPTKPDKSPPGVLQPKSGPIDDVFIPLAGLAERQETRYLRNRSNERLVKDILPLPPLHIARMSEKMDPKLLSWLERWDAGLQGGQSPSPEQLGELKELLAATQVSWSTLYGIGQGIAFIGGEELSLPWYGAMVHQAQAELQVLSSDDPAVEEIHQALLRISNPLYGNNRFADAEKVFALLKTLEPPGSQEAWKAGYWEAESWYMLSGSDPTVSEKAVELFKAMLASPEAQNRSEAERSQIHYGIGLALCHMGRFAEAMPHFKAAGEAEDYKPKKVTYALLRGSIQLGNAQEAEVYYREYLQKYSLPVSESLELATMIEAIKLSKLQVP